MLWITDDFLLSSVTSGNKDLVVRGELGNVVAGG